MKPKRMTIEEMAQGMVGKQKNPIIRAAKRTRELYRGRFESLCYEYADLLNDLDHVRELNKVMSERARHIIICLPTAKEIDTVLMLLWIRHDFLAFNAAKKQRIKERMNKLLSLRKISIAREDYDEYAEKPQGRYEDIIKEETH